MVGDDLSGEQLLYIVGTIDAELFADGMDIKERLWSVPEKAMQKLGYVSHVMFGHGVPKILERIRAAYSLIYRPQDLTIGGHIDVFMYRDIFAKISVPMVFGEVSIDPFKCVDLTHVQLRIMNSEIENIETYIDQFCDIADIQYGSYELIEPFCHQELTQRFIGSARLHLHAAAAILTGGYDYRGAVQSALLATELALKAGIATLGMTEQQIKDSYGHKSEDLVKHLAVSFAKLDKERLLRVVASQPKYVKNRYAAEQPKRREVGHIVMGAQYVVAEVVRQLSDRDFRECSEPVQKRRYPA